MRSCFLYLALFIFFPNSLYCQIKSRVDANFTTIEGGLKVYDVDSCLIDLLREVVNLDKSKRFPSELYFYELFYEDHGSYKKLTILPSRWEKSMTLDFKGILRVGKMSFLFRGDIENDSLFHMTEKNINVFLKKPIEYQYDSIDVMIQSYSWNPTLVGVFKLCKGKEIDVYILVGKKLERYLIKSKE